ncbi:LAFE_0G00320g1_1 [Lachancea fermentati]|uniref:L-serine ammonia-lyase n=1 Tax=Lachancea fermentati TaxID=4955 RepID=A0A1G4MGM1_LACFM|nr:LAFE_0G00320g1_1 [Lachancea fermentati]
MTNFFVKTPLIEYKFWSSLAKNSTAKFLLKYEFLQPSGSFKSRGIGHLIHKRVKNIKSLKIPHVFASSGGNAGLAAAVASRQLSIPCSVVIPTKTKRRMINKIKNTGASVIVHGDHWKDCDTFLKDNILKGVDRSLIEPIYVHPFDDPLIWEGHSGIIEELIASLKEADISLNRVKGIVCSIGGGGLYNGLVMGLERYGLAHKIPIVGVETNGCHVFHESLKKGSLVEFKEIQTIATSLGTANISRATLNFAKKYKSKSIVLKDSDVLDTCLKFSNDNNLIVEPACGAALHIGYNPNLLTQVLGQDLSSNDIILIIACGGSSTSFSDLENLRNHFIAG